MMASTRDLIVNFTNGSAGPSFDDRVLQLAQTIGQDRGIVMEKLRGIRSLFGPGVHTEVELAVERLDEDHQERQHLMAMRIQGLEADLLEKSQETAVLEVRADRLRELLTEAARVAQEVNTYCGVDDPDWLVEAVELTEAQYLDPRPSNHRCRLVKEECIGPRCPHVTRQAVMADPDQPGNQEPY